MKKSNVVKVDFKIANKRADNSKKENSAKCCNHLDKCAGHSLIQ